MRLKTPCPARADRVPNVGGWFCRTCERDVVDLTRLTRKRAMPLIERGGICIHAALDRNGDPIFAPEPPERSLLHSVALAGALAVGCGGPQVAAPEPRARIEAPPMTPETLPVGIDAT